MAGENWLSSVKVGGTEYSIHAESALSAGWVAASSISGNINANQITAVNESAISSISESAITSIPNSAIPELTWSSISGMAVGPDATTNSGIWTPSATRDFVSGFVEGKISNVYKFKGTCSVGDLPSNAENGDVWDLSVGGTINPSDTAHSAVVLKGDNVAWVTATGGGYWDKLAESFDIGGKLDTEIFTAWSANSGGNSQFLGSANSALTANVTVNVSGSNGVVAGDNLINSAISGAEAWTWISGFTASGQPIVGVDSGYLSGDGTTASKLGLKAPENSITTATPTSALVDAQGISSFVDNNYVAKSDIRIENSHQLVIDNT